MVSSVATIDGIPVYRVLVDDGDVQQHNFLMELVDNPVGLRAIDPAE